MPDKRSKLQEITDPDLLEGEEVSEPASASIADQVSQSLSGLVPESKRDLVMDQLRHETGDPNFESNVSRQNNNVSGITWNESFPADWKGTPRPKKEGGYYVHFPTYNDWAKAHIALLKKDHGAGAPIDASNIEDYAHRLKVNGYYTAPESEYVAGMKRMRQQYGSGGAASSGLQEITDPDLLEGEEVADNQAPAKPPMTGEEVLGISYNPPADVPAPLSTTQRTANAAQYLANDLTGNLKDLPPEYGENLRVVPFTDKGSLIHDFTDPHGDPSKTAGYLNTRLAQLNRDYKQQQPQIYYDGDPQTIRDFEKTYHDKITDLKNSAYHIIDLQLANKAQQTKNFDPIALGIERQKLLGDLQAASDEIKYRSGRPLNENAKMAYETQGYAILQQGKQQSADAGQHAIAQQFAEHSDDPESRLEKNNPEVFKKEAMRQIANEHYKRSSKLYDAVFSGRKMTETEMKEIAKDLGLSKYIKDVNPEDIPVASSLLGRTAQSFINTTSAPIYEGAMRALAKIPIPLLNRNIANEDAVNERFYPGWEEENAIGHLFTGVEPEAQKSLAWDNPYGIISEVASAAGALGGFLGEAKVGSAALKAVGASAKRAEQVANFTSGFLPSYNSAYEKATQEFGDNPKDEGKRTIYALTNGIIGGAIMNVAPKADLARDIIGDTKAGKSFIQMIKDGTLEKLTKDEFQNKAAKVISETADHYGMQIKMPVAQTMAGNLTDMYFDPEGKHDIMDNVQEAAISAGIGMALPSILAGMHAPANQTAMNKALLFDMGTKSRMYAKEVINAASEGKISHAEAMSTLVAIKKMGDIVRREIPAKNLAGKFLTPQQQQDYAWNLLRTSDLNDRMKAMDQQETPDEAQVKIVNDRLSELAKEREDILNNAGKDKMPAKPVREPEEKKSEQKEKKSKEDVSLSPEQVTEPLTTKSSDHGKRNEGQDGSRGQGSSEISKTQNIRPNAEVEGQAELETGQQPAPQGRQVEEPVSTSENKESKAGETEKESPAIPVSGKKKRKKLVASEEEAPAVPPITQEDAYRAWDQGNTEGKPEEEVKAQIEGAPHDEKIGGGESFIDFKDRIRKAWENTKKTAEDQTMLMTHSGVMKMIEAAEKHGWDDNDALRKAYNGLEEPEVGEKHTYKTDAGEIHVMRHAESTDGAKGLTRKKDTPLTPVGEQQAKEDIAGHIKEEGITPPEIITDTQPRTTHTAEIVQGELAQPKELAKGDKIQWDVYGNEDSGEWTVGERVKTRGGKEAVELHKEYVTSSDDGKTYTKEYADKNGIKYDNEPSVKTHVVPLDELTPKIEPDASTQSKEQQQEVPAKGSEPEHARVEQVGGEAAPAEAKTGDSIQRGEKQEAVKPKKPIQFGSPEENRKAGAFEKDGVVYARNEKQEGPTGAEGKIEFSKGVDKPYTYQLVEADNLQTASKDGNRNPLHFIPEAQPKTRTDAASKESAERIAEKPDLNKVGESPNAYSGAPVINARGEVIQGNNRAEGLVKHYEQKGKSYKEQLAANAEKYGLTKEQVEAMENPVLVRRVDVGDEEAIRLGNYDVKDIETGGKNRIDPVATSRRIPIEDKQQIVNALLADGEDKTLNQAIRDNFGKVIKLLKNHLRPAQMDALTNRGGEPSSDGLQDVERLITHFLFDKGDVNLPDHFEGLSDAAKKGLIRAFPKIFSVSEANSLLPEIQNALIAHEDFKTSGNPSFNSWKNQADMFAGGATPATTYTPLELKLAEDLSKAKTQAEIKNKFAEYAEKVNGKPGDMFGSGVEGISKAEAVKEVFKTPYDEKQARNEREAQEAERIEAAPDQPEIKGQEAEPKAELKVPEPSPEEIAEADKIREVEDRKAQMQNRLKEIEDDLLRQHAVQKQVAAKRLAANAAQDAEAFNKHNADWHKKQDKIDKLTEERKDIERQLDRIDRAENLQRSFTKAADAIRAFRKNIIKDEPGHTYASVIPFITPENVGKFLDHVADAVDKFGNLYVAIDSGIREYMERNKVSKMPTSEELEKIEKTLSFLKPQLNAEPILPVDHEEYAKDLLSDIQNKDRNYTLKDAYREVMEEVMENRDGKPVSDAVSRKQKSKILNYLDWHTTGRDTHNAVVLREQPNEKKYLSGYALSGSGEVSAYLSGKTLADVHGKDVQFDIDSKQTQLQQNIVQDTANIVGLAKFHAGSDDVLVYGPDMLHQINRIPDGGENSVKKLIAVTGLNNELHGERIRLENEMPTADKVRQAEITKRLRDINKMIAQAELKYRDITSNASDILNAARANRLYRNTYFHDLYADKILDEETQAAKEKTEKALLSTEIPDRVAEDGLFSTEEEGNKTAEQVIDEKNNSESGKKITAETELFPDQKAEPAKKKTKGFVERVKETLTGKKAKEERKAKVAKDVAERKAKEYLGGSSLDDLFKKAQEQTKKPC